MQIVIEIPKKLYIACEGLCKTLHLSLEEDAIGKGTPLPEHHGRLIDADVLVDGMEDDYEFCEAVNATPTIIPATGNEFFNFDASIIKKQTATKEGEQK